MGKRDTVAIDVVIGEEERSTVGVDIEKILLADAPCGSEDVDWPAIYRRRDPLIRCTTNHLFQKSQTGRSSLMEG